MSVRRSVRRFSNIAEIVLRTIKRQGTHRIEFLVAKCNSIKGFVHPSVHPSVHQVTRALLEKRKFKKIRVNYVKFKKIQENKFRNFGVKVVRFDTV